MVKALIGFDGHRPYWPAGTATSACDGKRKGRLSATLGSVAQIVLIDSTFYWLGGFVLSPLVLQDFEMRFTDFTSKFCPAELLGAAPLGGLVLEAADDELGVPFTSTCSPT